MKPCVEKSDEKKSFWYMFFKDFTLPGFHYLGPGSKKDNGPPTNTIDAIAKKHDEAYDQAVDDYKKSHNVKRSVEVVEEADEKFLLEIEMVKATTPMEYLGKVIGFLGIGVKAAVERSLGKTLYPNFDKIKDSEECCDENIMEDVDEPVTPTTPTPTPKASTPAPTPVPNCKLPLYPASDPAVTPASGVRLGTKFGSRVEYEPPPRLRNKFEFSINIKTVSSEGIILYVHDQKHIDFIALYLKDGRVHFSFNCGSGAALLESDRSVNDGEWHSVRFSREKIRGELTVDRDDPILGESKGTTKTINVNPPLYLGGIDPKISDNTKTNLRGLNNTFEGCLKDFVFNGKPVTSELRSVGVIPCSDNVEAGAFFSADGGYIKFSDKFRVGVEIDIKFDIKPRDLSGLLVSVHAKRDYLLLQMVDGTIRFSVDNGKGEIWAAYTPPTPHYFCDGQWHSIQAIKSKNVVSLSVDKTFVDPGIGQSSGTDTKHPLYIGGHPPTPRIINGLRTKAQFTGCIRNFEINGQYVAINQLPTFGNVTQSICPTI